jgi:hypothetical protein
MKGKRIRHSVGLRGGRVEAEGTLPQLLQTSAEMRQMWPAEKESASPPGRLGLY